MPEFGEEAKHFQTVIPISTNGSSLFKTVFAVTATGVVLCVKHSERANRQI